LAYQRKYRNRVWPKANYAQRYCQCCGTSSDDHGWGVFNSLFGWTNSATYGSVISYNLYWIVVIIGFLAMRYNEVHGHWPLMKSKITETRSDSDVSNQEGTNGTGKADESGVVATTAVRELRG
jgi:high-affinity iron transporter